MYIVTEVVADKNNNNNNRKHCHRWYNRYVSILISSHLHLHHLQVMEKGATIISNGNGNGNGYNFAFDLWRQTNDEYKDPLKSMTHYLENWKVKYPPNNVLL